MRREREPGGFVDEPDDICRMRLDAFDICPLESSKKIESIISSVRPLLHDQYDPGYDHDMLQENPQEHPSFVDYTQKDNDYLISLYDPTKLEQVVQIEYRELLIHLRLWSRIWP